MSKHKRLEKSREAEKKQFAIDVFWVSVIMVVFLTFLYFWIKFVSLGGLS